MDVPKSAPGHYSSSLTAPVYAIDWKTGLALDVVGPYLVPVMLAAYWLGLFPALRTS